MQRNRAASTWTRPCPTDCLSRRLGRKHAELATYPPLIYYQALHAPLISPLAVARNAIIRSCSVPIVPLKNTLLARQGKEKTKPCSPLLSTRGEQQEFDREENARFLPSWKSFDEIIILRKSSLMCYVLLQLATTSFQSFFPIPLPSIKSCHESSSFVNGLSVYIYIYIRFSRLIDVKSIDVDKARERLLL